LNRFTKGSFEILYLQENTRAISDCFTLKIIPKYKLEIGKDMSYTIKDEAPSLLMLILTIFFLIKVWL